MTLIIARKYPTDEIMIAADSSACFPANNYSTPCETKKLIHYDELDDIVIAGAGGSYRIISLLHDFIPPKIRGGYRSYGLHFANAWKKFLGEHDALSSYDNGQVAQEGGIILAVRDNLFEITSDFGAIRYKNFVAGGASRIQAYALDQYQKHLNEEISYRKYRHSPEFLIEVLEKNNGEIQLPIQQMVIE